MPVAPPLLLAHPWHGVSAHPEDQAETCHAYIRDRRVEDADGDLIKADIQEPGQRGDFDDLPGRNKPLEFEELPVASDNEQFEALLMRTMGEVAAEVLLVRDIRAQRAALAQVEGAEERERLLRALQQKRDELSAALKERRARRE